MNYQLFHLFIRIAVFNRICCTNSLHVLMCRSETNKQILGVSGNFKSMDSESTIPTYRWFYISTFHVSGTVDMLWVLFSRPQMTS
jgi:hypothetical protein